ncbi:DnaJ-domain-containing protein [Polyporus arcularius HHB13444]|uniref:DnaJ-domain-containing protein n=1 Tax=Polyporus arcularius HHB13444 TaxID=1314778 RepID=A0A5C3PES0_9APHY|nr:DnaJ-domain-containing protein [Polyporus arcularius HHB13444]
MVLKQSAIVEAYTVLGLEQGASLELVKTTYKQLALKTHPDKNPDDEDATAQFQRLSEAYNTLLKHLDRSSAPAREHSHTHFHPFGYDDGDYDDDDDYYYDDEFYDDYESDYEEKMDFYRFLFEELLRGRASRFAHSQYHHHHPHHHHHESPPETAEQYAARLRRQREEKEQAAERRAREEADRKANQERERERQRREAEQRQRAKSSAKKAEAEASRKAAEQKVRAQQEKVQALRSKVFEAARRKDAAAVKKGVYEDNVDASGGEIRKGAESFAKSTPVDPKETLLHIAAKHGDIDLVQWLDSHGAEPDERNGEDMTAYHIALRNGYPEIVKHYYETYPPTDKDYAYIYRSPKSQSTLRVALESREPELAWMVLDKSLYNQTEIDDAWKLVASKKFKSSISPAAKYDEFKNLFATYGGYSASSEQPENFQSADSAPSSQPSSRQQNGKSQQQGRPRPIVTTNDVRSHTTSPVSAVSENPQTPMSASPSTNSSRGGRGRGRGRGQFRGRGRGRGRGEAPVGVASA